MVQILEDQPSFGQLMARGAGQNVGAALAGGLEGYIGKKEKEKLAKQLEEENAAIENMGIHLRGIKDPALRKTIVSESLKSQGNRQKTTSDEKMKNLEGIKSTIEKMRTIASGEAEGIGPIAQYNPFGGSFYNRAQLKTLSSDLLSFYKSLFPRGITQEEFKRLERDYIPSTGDPISSIHGKLDAFEDLINRKLSEQEPSEFKSSKSEKTKFNPNNPSHVAKLKQLDKAFGGDRKKVNEALAKEFGL